MLTKYFTFQDDGIEFIRWKWWYYDEKIHEINEVG